MMGPAYILFGLTRRRVRLRLRHRRDPLAPAIDDAVEFNWDGNDEMDEACGDGWAELQDDGSLEGEICFHGGDETPFIARPGRLLQQPARSHRKMADSQARHQTGIPRVARQYRVAGRHCLALQTEGVGFPLQLRDCRAMDRLPYSR